MKKFTLYHKSSIDSNNCNFEINTRALTPNSKTTNYIREYLRELYKNENLTEKVGEMTLICNAFITPTSTIRSADASFLLPDGSIFTKVIGECNAKNNGDAEIGHQAVFSIIGGSGKYEGSTGTVTQIIESDQLRKLKFRICK